MKYTKFVLLCLFLGGCQSEIYVRDGVTDGNTFHLPPAMALDTDPVIQSWVSYSAAKSVCQLALDTDNPARANSFDCEFSARSLLLDTWAEMRAKHPNIKDEYLDALAMVRESAYLDEYVVYYFKKPDWFVPGEVDIDAFTRWRRVHLSQHKPHTQIIGSWVYSKDPK